MTTTPNAPRWPQHPAYKADGHKMNPTCSSLTDSQAREFAVESGTCSDGTQCGTFAETAYCDDCPNRLQPDYDLINPSHYRAGKVECIDALEAATVNKRGIEAVCTANAIKYLWRYESKGGLEDVRKARWYIERLAKHLGE